MTDVQIENGFKESDSMNDIPNLQNKGKVEQKTELIINQTEESKIATDTTYTENKIDSETEKKVQS